MKQSILLFCAALSSAGCFATHDTNVETMVSEWGTNTPAYDQKVAVDLLASSNGVIPGHEMNPRFLHALVQRIEERPDLLLQISNQFRKMQEHRKSSEHNGEWYVAELLSDMNTYADTTARQCVNIFVCASLFNRADWVEDLEWNIVPARWDEVSTWLELNKYYAVYDSDASAYVIQQAAKNAEKRVLPSQQLW